MLFRPMTRQKKAFVLLAAVLILVIFAVWTVRFYIVNKSAIRSEVITYKTGELVPFDGDFFLTSSENTNGYSIKVNSLELIDYSELMAKYIEGYDELPAHTYCAMLNITVKNDGNSDGGINTIGMTLYDGALAIPIDYDIWQLIDERFMGFTFRIRPNSEVELTIPYTAQLLDEAVNKKEVAKRLENDTFSLCISEYPKLKLIHVKANS